MQSSRNQATRMQSINIRNSTCPCWRMICLRRAESILFRCHRSEGAEIYAYSLSSSSFLEPIRSRNDSSHGSNTEDRRVRRDLQREPHGPLGCTCRRIEKEMDDSAKTALAHFAQTPYRGGVIIVCQRMGFRLMVRRDFRKNSS